MPRPSWDEYLSAELLDAAGVAPQVIGEGGGSS